MTYWWQCPKCGRRVTMDDLYYLFDEETGEAMFNPEEGFPFLVLYCPGLGDGCDASWVMEMSPMRSKDTRDEISRLNDTINKTLMPGPDGKLHRRGPRRLK